MDRGNAFRRIGIFLALGFWFFVMVALASFHVNDWPAFHVYPHGPVENLCGSVGSLMAYFLYRFMGQGIYLVLFFTGVVLGLSLVRKQLSDMWLRVIGLVLVSITFAAMANNMVPGSSSGFPEGNGGILGLATANYLQVHFNKAGSWILLIVTFLVGMVLAADEFVAVVPGYVAAGYAKAREIAPKIPRPGLPNFNFLRRTSGGMPATSGSAPVVAQPTTPGYTVVTPQTAQPTYKPAFKPTPPNMLDGLARVITSDEEQTLRAKLAAQPRDLPAGPITTSNYVATQALPPTPEVPPVEEAAIPEAPAPVIMPADAPAMEFEYAHDNPAEPEPAAAVADMAHEDTNDPPPAEAAVIPPPPPLLPPLIKPEIVVRMPGMIQPRRMAPAPLQSPRELGEYSLPGWNLLGDAETNFVASQETVVREKALVLEQALREFSIDAQVVAINTGPVITMYEISMAPGTKVAQITALTNDIARALAATNVRIVAPVPGKNTVGVEVPNAQKEKVRLKELMQLTSQETQTKMGIPLFLGKDANGEPLVADLAAMPHCLIAGTTGSGKSVCINSIIMSVMYTQRPDHVKLVLFDPKIVEMAPFKDIPHLMCPVITETGKAASVLEWACEKMDERYSILNEAGVRNLAGFNKLTREELFERFGAINEEEQAKVPKHLPYIVIIIDELADLMMTSGKEVEASIVRLAQKARAVGIHLILATQRPQATVVTGLIKANMPCKIAFRVASKMDSRIVLDQNGAELLLGQGDMLYLPGGAGKPVRAQGTFIEDREIRDSVKLVAANAQAQYEPELVQLKPMISADGEGVQDEMFDDAVRIVLENQRGSVSLLQRKLNIGYGRASRLIEMMAGSGILGDYKGSQAREVMLTLEDWDAMKGQRQADEDSGMTV